MKLDGSTSGGDYRIESRTVLSDGTICTLWTETKHCPHATRMRLRRVPKWLAVFADDAGLGDLTVAYAKWRIVRRLFKNRMQRGGK